MTIQDKVVKVGQWGLAVWLYNLFNKIYDYVIYTAVIAKYGAVIGGAIMMMASLILDLVTLHLYYKNKTDIFGFEAIKALRDAEPQLFRERLTKWALQKSNWLVFLILSLISNSFVVTAYLGERSENFEGLRRKDWAVFLSSFLLGHLAWILAITGAIKLAQEYLSAVLQN